MIYSNLAPLVDAVWIALRSSLSPLACAARKQQSLFEPLDNTLTNAQFSIIILLYMYIVKYCTHRIV